MNPMYKARGGGWYGFMVQGSWPFAKLEIYDDHLIFGVGTATKTLHWNEIEYAKRLLVLPLIADGVVIVPKDREPKILIFWALRPNKILSLLQSKGVNTQTRFTNDIIPYIAPAYVVDLLLIVALLMTFQVI